LTSSSNTVTFDSAKGTATFNDLVIDQKGMYLIFVNVKTAGSSDYNFNCISTPVTVKGSAQALKSAENDAPNMYLTFSGNFTKHKDNLKHYESMLYNCIFVKHGLNMDRSITLYQGSIKAVFSSSGATSSFTDLVTALTNFTLADDVVLVSGTILDQDYNFSRSDSSSVVDSNTVVQKQADAEKQNAV
jgi:hypothetical protein